MRLKNFSLVEYRTKKIRTEFWKCLVLRETKTSRRGEYKVLKEKAGIGNWNETLKRLLTPEGLEEINKETQTET